MNSAVTRANVVIFFGASAILIACLLGDVAVRVLEHPQPRVQIANPTVTRLRPVQRLPGLSTEALVKFDLDVDLSDAISWNTKQLFVWVTCEYATPKRPFNQVVIWDTIISGTDRPDAVFSAQGIYAKYRIQDIAAPIRYALQVHAYYLPVCSLLLQDLVLRALELHSPCFSPVGALTAVLPSPFSSLSLLSGTCR